MAWKKIVQRLGTGHCPKCGNSGFNYVSDDEWRKDEDALVKCAACGWTGLLREMIGPGPKRTT
jgi:DNA-directed RNA polymerase subunit M/transcription elongation factor TFIIS